MTREDVAKQIHHWQSEGKVVGFTSGVFDLLHAGHLDYLIKAKEYCDHLVVAVNDDASVRGNKGPKRPIVSEGMRVALINGLKPVDQAFLFSEANNNTNIEILKPDVYIKAGDYDLAKLSSAALVQAYGGEIRLIPVVHETSTSSMIHRIVSSEMAVCEELPRRAPRPGVILDRDGVINNNIEYLHRPEQFELLPYVIEGLQALSRAGYALAIATNQCGIGLGYYSHEDFYKVNRALFRAFAGTGIIFERIYYCPHSLSDTCSCRKPANGMLERAIRELNLQRDTSWMIGDSASDIQAGKASRLSTLLIQEGKAGVGTVNNLQEAAEVILQGRMP